MINKVTLIGNAGGDPDIRTLENGTQVGRFSLATNESYKDKEGNWQNQTEWHNVIVWRDLAERAATSIRKGSTVYVEGKITYRKYTDKDGAEKTVTDIVCNYFRVLDKKEAGQSANIPTTEPPNAPQNPVARQETNQAQQSESDNLPF
jgi:single-strand DNA-binding protein